MTVRLPLLLIVAATFAYASPVKAQVPTAQCPEDFQALTNWWETTPDLVGVAEVRMQLTFQNTIGDALSFSATPDQTIQVWTTPSVFAPSPLIFHSAPSGTVANGETYSYDITAGIGAFPGEDGLAVRPRDNNLFGTLGPARTTLVSASFQCQAAVGEGSFPIPAASTWSLLVLLALLVATAAWRVRARRTAD